MPADELTPDARRAPGAPRPPALGRGRGAGPHAMELERHAARRGRPTTGPACGPCTSPGGASGRCGTSPPASTAARWRPTSCRTGWAGTSCPRPSWGDGLPFGVGSLQRFVPFDVEAHYFTLLEDPARHPRLRTIGCFDLLANSADRKGGHCLAGHDGRIWAVDNGLTFHREPKLRTVIWDFASQSSTTSCWRGRAGWPTGGPDTLDGLLDDRARGHWSSGRPRWSTGHVPHRHQRPLLPLAPRLICRRPRPTACGRARVVLRPGSSHGGLGLVPVVDSPSPRRPRRWRCPRRHRPGHRRRGLGGRRPCPAEDTVHVGARSGGSSAVAVASCDAVVAVMAALTGAPNTDPLVAGAEPSGPPSASGGCRLVGAWPPRTSAAAGRRRISSARSRRRGRRTPRAGGGRATR